VCPRDEGAPALGPSGPAPSPLPQSGYFAPADPNAAVIPFRPRGSGDPLKKGGRYDEEFIWNTKWQDAMKYEEDVKRQIQEAKVSGRAGGEA